MNNTIQYKGYVGSIEFSEEDKIKFVINKNKNKFHFEPIGRIGSPNGAFDAYVMAVNDSIDPQEAKDLKKMVLHYN